MKTFGLVSIYASMRIILSALFAVNLIHPPVEGIASNATVINIPIAYGNDDFINPLNLSRAISTAIEQGVNIIRGVGRQ